jgi:hypothetical protein
VVEVALVSKSLTKNLGTLLDKVPPQDVPEMEKVGSGYTDYDLLSMCKGVHSNTVYSTTLQVRSFWFLRSISRSLL